ncbi:MAG: ATP-binding protein [Candidatus Limnocylindria bacterium]
MPDRPSGLVTFLFSDIEGSTALLQRHERAMRAALTRHHELFEETIAAHDGVIFETVGDAVYAAFERPTDAVGAAIDAHRRLAAEDWQPIDRLAVRIALHTGEVDRRGDHYVGGALFRCARLQALGYGEQTLVSSVTARLVADGLPDGATLDDLGMHRLKDLGEPEHVHQLQHPDLRSSFPPPKGLDTHAHNLPIQLSTFLGRETELAEMSALLDRQRIVTVLGPAGIGKTRLALQVAADRLERHPDGVFFVDLSTTRDPELVASAIGTALQLQEQPGRRFAEGLRDHLGDRDLLLVLDNLEQLLPSAGATVAELLSSAPNLRVLVTSRAPLRITGEHEFVVRPLDSGDPDRPEQRPAPAVALFSERARAIRPDFVADRQTGPMVAAICDALDGLPLAIELAASRLRLFSLPALQARLEHRLPLLTGGVRDRPERQQTLRAAIAWSEELLAEDERSLFLRLGVFVGGFTLDAVEAVGGPALADPLEPLSALVEHSLVHEVGGLTGEPRYRMLETIREYALELLRERGEETVVRDLHLAHFVAFGERAYGERFSSSSTWIPVTDAEHDNVRAALDWAGATDARAEAELAGAIAPYWYMRGHITETRDRLMSALERYRERDAIRARALTQLGEILWRVDQDTALARHEEALALWGEIGDARGEAHAFHGIGKIHTARGNSEAARRALQASVDRFQAVGAHEIEIAYPTASFCQSYISVGDIDRAEPMADATRTVGIRHDNRPLLQLGLHFLADCALIREDYPVSEQRYRHALDHARQWRMTTQATNELLGVAMSVAGQGDHGRAVRLAATAYAKIEAMGMKRGYLGWWDRIQERYIGGARTHLSANELAEAERIGREASWDATLDEVLGA